MSTGRRLFRVGAWLWLIWVLVLPFAHRHPHPNAGRDIVFQGFNNTEQAICVACWWSHTVFADGSSIHKPPRPISDAKIIPHPEALPLLSAFKAVSRAPPA